MTQGLIDIGIAERISERLKELAFSAREASLKTGRGPDVIRNILRAVEAGKPYSPRADTLQLLASVLQTTPDWLLGGGNVQPAMPAETENVGTYKEPPRLIGDRNLPVFASVECGPGEMTVFSTDPIEIVARPWYVEREPDAFGVVMTGDSMEPVYEAGEIAIVSKKAPLVKGKDAIFMAEPVGGDFRASLKRYRGQTTSDWLASQFNPPPGQKHDIKFKRDIWRLAYRILGSYDR